MPNTYGHIKERNSFSKEAVCVVAVELLSCVRLFATPWTVACHSPLSMEFPRQEYWSGLLFSSPGNLPYPVIYPHLLHWQADTLRMSCLGSSKKAV